MKLDLSISDRYLLKAYQKKVIARTDYIKVTVILLLDKGKSSQEIADDLGIDDSTVYKYFHAYEKDGLSSYLMTHYTGNWGLLSSIEISALRTELNINLYTDSKQIIAWIERQFGIKYSISGVNSLLHRIGYSYIQTKSVPCEANTERQIEFLGNILTELEEISDDETSVAYYLDAVHPTHNTRSTHAWIERGTERTIPTVSGRDRVNINGALNPHDVTDIQIVEAKTINAQTTKELYQKLIDKNPSAKCIYTISDNARYYHNKELKEWLICTPIVQIFLPPYSPNLNLIERLWKFCRKKVINTNFYRTKEEFKKAIMLFFQNIKDYKDELVTLLSLNFHVC
jgi:transposase